MINTRFRHQENTYTYRFFVGVGKSTFPTVEKYFVGNI